jgi:subtilase family serine protease
VIRPWLLAGAFAAAVGSALAPACVQAASLLAAGVKVAPDFRDAGRAAAGTPVRVAFTLAYRHQAELDALVLAQSDPRSPYFHHYLSSAQFRAYFAPGEADYARVVQTLRAAGFTLDQTFPNRTVIDAIAPSAAAERFFGTEIHSGVQAGHGVRYANVVPATLPASLRGLVVSFSGLDNLIGFAPRYQIGTGEDDPDLIGPPLKGPQGGYGPLAFAQGYDEPVQFGYDGTGRSIANVMAGDISDTDLAGYLQEFNITPAFGLTRIKVDGGAIGHFDVETTLDVEGMTGTAPGAKVYLYSFAEFTDTDAEDAYNQIVSDDVVDAANSSWGGCESDTKGQLGNAFALASNQIFEQGSSVGITFPIATGDQGSRTCVDGGKVDETTADSDPYALAVGGTTLKVNKKGTWVREKGWRGSAGGVSVVFPLPTYQSGVPNIITSGRNIPDVSLDSNPRSGMAELKGGKWFYVGGTSMASPLWVGLEAQIDQLQNTRIGFVNPRLYQLLQGSQYGTLFHDITDGSNGGYKDLPGFDQVTGIGSPLGMALAQAGL